MQLGQAQIVRSNWYDRARLFVNAMFAGNLSPHSEVDRVNYTVPSNRVARVVFSPITCVRTNAASASASYKVIYYFTPSGGSEVVLGIFFGLGNLTYVYNTINVRGEMLIESGDNLRFTSEDLSTLGNVSFNFGAMITEYDA